MTSEGSYTILSINVLTNSFKISLINIEERMIDLLISPAIDSEVK